jgi:hypothetical protein
MDQQAWCLIKQLLALAAYLKAEINVTAHNSIVTACYSNLPGKSNGTRKRP